MGRFVWKDLLCRGDLNGFWALFADNLANMIIISGVCIYVLNISPQVVFGTILPALGVALVVGLCYYAWLAARLKAASGREDVTALPYGISTPVMFVYLFLIMKPVADQAIAAGATPDEAGLTAWRVGMAAAFVGGIVEASGALVGPWLQRHLPRAGMLGTLAGIALVWIATVPLAEIYEDPLVGFASLAIILAGLVALYRLPLGIPAGLAAIAVGTVIGALTGHCTVTTENVGLYPPVPVIGDLLAGLDHLFSNPWVFAIVIPAEIYNFIETMNNVESARAAGDEYPVGRCQVMDGLGTLVGSIFGSPFPTTVYIGHPGYKRLGSRVGYGALVSLVFMAGSMFGLVGFLHGLIPLAAVAPVLVFIGIVITGQAFSANPPKHAMAVAIAMVPHVSNLLVTQWGALAKVLKGDVGLLYASETVDAMAMEGGHVAGHAAMFNGSILIGLLWGAMVAFLIDRKAVHAAAVAVTAGLFTAIGMIHVPMLGLNDSPIVWGYAMVAVVCVVLHVSKAGAVAGD